MAKGSNSRSYDIHGLLKFTIVGSQRRPLLGPINWEFSYFETSDQCQQPDIVLNLGEFAPSKMDCYLLDNKYFVRQNYLYCADSAGRAKWEAEIVGFESGRTIANFNGSMWGKEAFLYPDLLAQDLILKPLLEYKLCRRKSLLIHAAAVCRDNKAYLLAGRGGSKKTTLVLQLIQRYGFHLMADDQIIIKNKTVLSFPKHIAQLNFKFKHMHTEEYGLLDKLRLIGFLQRAQLDLQIPRSAHLRAIVFISRSNMDGVRVVRLPEDTAVKKITVNNIIDMNSLGGMSGLFLRYMQAYCFIFPHSSIARHWPNMRQELTETLSEVPVFEMRVPDTITPRVVDEIERLLQHVD